MTARALWFVASVWAAALGMVFLNAAEANLPYTATISWTPPSTFTDGAPLDPATDVAEYRIYCQPDPGSVYLTVPASPPYQYESPPGLFVPGTYTCHMTTVAVPAKGGLESDPSPETKTFTIEAAKPSATIIFTVQ